MLFNLTRTQAEEVAAIADACSNKNDGRITLETVCIEVDQTADGLTTLRVIATDSYTLAKREVDIDGEVLHDEGDDEFVVDPTERDASSTTPHLMVEGKMWKKAIKDTITHDKLSPVLMSITTEEIVVTSHASNAPEMTIPIARNSGTYPKWRSLLGTPFTEVNGKLPAFDPVKLANMAKFVSVKPSDRSVYPFRMKATTDGETKDASLRPWLFTLSHSKPTRSELEVLLMPVRV